MHTTSVHGILVTHNGDWSGEAEIRGPGGHAVKVRGSSFLALCLLVASRQMERFTEMAVDSVIDEVQKEARSETFSARLVTDYYSSVPDALSLIPSNIRRDAAASGVDVHFLSDVDILNVWHAAYHDDETILDILQEVVSRTWKSDWRHA